MSGAEVIDYWWLIPLILMGLCIFGARGCSGRKGHRSGNLSENKNETSSDSALEVLSKRYARGAIDDEEYRRKSATITQARKGEPK